MNRPRLDTALVTLGTGLVGAVVLLSTLRTRANGSLDGSNFVLGLVGALGLLAVAVAAYLLAQDHERRTVLMAYPGAAGAGAVALIWLAAANFNTVSEWLAGLLTLVLAAGGFWFTRQVPYIVAGVSGAAFFYAKLVFQLTGLSGSAISGNNIPSHILIWVSLAIWIGVAIVTAVAWFLPGRHIVAVWIGALGLAGNVLAIFVLFVVISVFNALVTSFTGGHSTSPLKVYTNGDVVVTMIFGAIAIAAWCFLYLLSGVAGYRVLIVAGAAYIPATSALAMLTAHPSVWELVLGILGGGVLVGILGMGLVGRTPRGPGMPPGGPGMPPGGPGWPAEQTAPGGPGYGGGYPTAQPPTQPPAYPPSQPPAYPPVQQPQQPQQPPQPGYPQAPPAQPGYPPAQPPAQPPGYPPTPGGPGQPGSYGPPPTS